MYFKEDVLQYYFQCYQSERTDARLSRLWQYMVLAARVLLRAYARKKRLSLPEERTKEVVINAVGRFVAFLLANPDRREDIPVRGRIMNELLYELHGSPTRRNEHSISVESANPESSWLEIHKELDEESASRYIRQILTDTRINGRRVIFDLFSHKYYKTAILKIAQYTGRDLMRGYAVQLHTIFTMTRTTWTKVPRLKAGVIHSGSPTTFSRSSLVRALKTDSQAIRLSLSHC